MRRRHVLAGLLGLFSLAALAQAAGAVDSKEWALTSVEEFFAGEFEGVILESPGTLRVGLAQAEYPLDAGQVWSVAEGPDGVMYVGTGNEARVFIVPRKGESQTNVQLDGSQVYAVTATTKGDVFAASSPNGAIYRITRDGAAEEWFRTEATYIWGLAGAADGGLYAVTGAPAQLLHISGRNQGKIVFTTEANHFISVAEHSSGRVLVGTDDSGLVYAVGRDGAARVLYDSPAEEIRSLLPVPSGDVYFVAVQSRLTGGAPSVALKLSGLGGEANTEEGTDEDAQRREAQTQVLRRTGPAASVLYRIDSEGRVAPIWTGEGHRVYAASLLGEDVLLATDARGTLFRVTADGRPAVLYRGRAEKITAAHTGTTGAVLLGTSEGASLIRLGPEASDRGVYTSAVQDAGTQATYGRVRWTVRGAGTTPDLRVRTGNTREPGATWTEWSEPLRDPAGTTVTAANARYLQLRLEWRGRARDALVTAVHVPFVPQNLGPSVLRVDIETPGRLAVQPVNAGAEADATVLQNLLKLYADGDKASGSQNKAEEETHNPKVKITWKALDPNGDRLQYSVHFRGAGEALWKELAAELDKAEYEWDTTLVPDGEYELRVTATDAPSNAVVSALSSDRTSEPVVVDNTGPVVAALKVEQQRGKPDARVTGRVEDKTLQVRQAQYSVDGQPWRWFASDDGIFDSGSESFAFDLTALEAGEHTIAIRATDAARNIGMGKAVFTVE